MADVGVREDTPNTKAGASKILEVDANTRKITYLRVQASGIGAQSVSRAVLRLTVANATDAESDAGGRVSSVSNCAWDEGATTWSTRPAIDGPVLFTVAGAVDIGDTVDFDVTPGIPGDGTYCFAVETGSGNMVKYNSREAASARPTVVLTVAPPTT